jgi:phage shock protein A
MTHRDLIRDCQRQLTKLDSEYRRALTRASAAKQRRADILAEHDRLVVDAELSVDLVVAAMAAEVGSDLAAKLVERQVSDVKRLLKHHRDAQEQDTSR